MPVKAITLPEPPGSPTKSEADIFETGAYSVIRRAVIIGNGVEDYENQSIGLVHALGMSEKHVLHVSARLFSNSINDNGPCMHQNLHQINSYT